MNIEQLSDLIRRRRSTPPATFTGEPVPESVVWQMLENANWAPTHQLSEPWRFKVFTGAALEQLSNFLASAYDQLTPAEAYSPMKRKKMSGNPRFASHAIAICMKRHEKVIEVEEIEAVGCAVQNMWLTAVAHGVGGFWSSPPLVYHPLTSAFLELEPNERCLGFFYIGYPSQHDLQSKRNPVSDKVVWRTA